MINAVDSTGIARAIERRSEPATATPAQPTAPVEPTVAETVGNIATPAALLAAEGAPVDTARVEAIRAAIANGTYRIDPKGIANRMIALDLGRG